MKAKALMLSGLLLLAGCQSPTAQSPEPEINVGEMDGVFIGLVENGKLRVLLPALSGSIRLTEIGMQVAMPPDARELDLTKYEGTAIAVQGHNGGGWIYSARVIDTGGPIVTALVQKVLGQ